MLTMLLLLMFSDKKEEPPPPCAVRTMVVSELSKVEKSINTNIKKVVIVKKAEPHFGNSNIENIIRDAAAKFGQDPNLLLRIAKCESGFDTNDKNSHSSASGLFQFIAGTWAGTPEGQAGKSVFDPVANAEAAARKIRDGGLSAWNASKNCWKR